MELYIESIENGDTGVNIRKTKVREHDLKLFDEMSMSRVRFESSLHFIIKFIKILIGISTSKFNKFNFKIQ